MPVSENQFFFLLCDWIVWINVNNYISDIFFNMLKQYLVSLIVSMHLLIKGLGSFSGQFMLYVPIVAWENSGQLAL